MSLRSKKAPQPHRWLPINGEKCVADNSWRLMGGRNETGRFENAIIHGIHALSSNFYLPNMLISPPYPGSRKTTYDDVPHGPLRG